MKNNSSSDSHWRNGRRGARARAAARARERATRSWTQARLSSSRQAVETLRRGRRSRSLFARSAFAALSSAKRFLPSSAAAAAAAVAAASAASRSAIARASASVGATGTENLRKLASQGLFVRTTSQ